MVDFGVELDVLRVFERFWCFCDFGAFGVFVFWVCLGVLGAFLGVFGFWVFWFSAGFLFESV